MTKSKEKRSMLYPRASLLKTIKTNREKKEGRLKMQNPKGDSKTIRAMTNGNLSKKLPKPNIQLKTGLKRRIGYNQLSQKIDELEKNNITLQNKINDMNTAKELQEMLMDNKKKELYGIQSKIENSKTDSKTFEKEKENLNLLLKEESNKNESLLNQFLQKEKKIEVLKGKTNNLKNSIKSIQLEKELVQKRLFFEIESNKKSSENYSDLKKNVEEMRISTANLEDIVKKLKYEKESLENDLKSQKEKFEDLKRELIEVEKKNSKISLEEEKKLKKEKEHGESLGKRIKELEEAMKKNEDELKTAGETIREMTANNEKLKNCVQDLETDRDLSRNRLKLEKGKNELLNDELDQLKKKHEKKMSKEMEKLNEEKERAEDLKKEINTAKDSLRAAKTEIEDQKDEVERLKASTKKLKRNFDEQIEDLDRNNSKKLKSKDGTIEEFEDNIKRLEGKIESLEDESMKKSERMDKLRLEVAKKVNDLAALRKLVGEKEFLLNRTDGAVKTQMAIVTEKDDSIADLSKERDKLLADIKIMEEKIQKGELIRKKLHNKVQDLKGNIRVFCRIRPIVKTDTSFSDKNRHKGFTFANEGYLQKLFLLGKPKSDFKGDKVDGQRWDFTFDRIFKPWETQSLVFEEISQLVQSALDGYKVCIFAYGQTGSGKTHTMEGSGRTGCDDDGIINRSVEKIFETIQSLKDKNWSFECTAMFIEIYNETLRDLLATKKSEKLAIRHIDKPYKDTIVSNCEYVKVSLPKDISPLLERAKKTRAIGRTNSNERSSRSHSVFQLTLKGTNLENGQTTLGVLNLIDLAGSERLDKSKSKGMRLVEAQNINKSLSSLGNVITSLNNNESHIPFRDSKLTWLLKNCFGGDCKTLMFVNLSPDPREINESLNSLRFAQKVNECYVGTARRNMKVKS